MDEYKLVKESYIADFQTNYQINLNEKQANIDSFKDTIAERKEQKEDFDRQLD